MTTLQHWQAVQKNATFHDKMFINGQFVASVSGDTFDNINPATGRVNASVANGNTDDVNNAVISARQAFNRGDWAGLTPSTRKEVLIKLADLIMDNMAELAVLETSDMGKPINDATNIDIPGAAAILKWHAEAIDKIYDEIAPVGGDNQATIRRQAVGVVAAVVPWNFPLDMAIWKLAPALAVGNSVIVKPSEDSPSSILRVAELAIQAGVPAGVLNVVTGLGPLTGKALGEHMDMDCLAFTGSTVVGKEFLKYSGNSNMKAVYLECGGKSPNLIFADADIKRAAKKAAFGIFWNQGEVCSANSRILVEKSIKDEFIAELEQASKAWQPNNPLNPESAAGCIVNKKQHTKICEYIKSGKQQAQLVFGGDSITIDGVESYITPTLFDCSDNHNVDIFTQEIFGPVASLITFESENEAVEIANNSIYGLAASVWTNNLQRAHRLSHKITAGTVSINTVDALSPMTPFGGFKQSGFGRDLSLHAFDKYSQLKTIWIDYSTE